MLTVACVQTGNYLGRGVEYVHNLARMVSENLTLPHRFTVVTDDAPENYDGMRVLPAKHAGWWEKLRLFSLFDGRVMFLDLDTVILKNIDHVAAYDGPFATLTDFWRPGRGLGPAVMLFDAAYARTFYEEWAAEGFPKVGNGDQTWLENRDQGRFRKSVDILQTMYPGEFVSYKEHCTAGRRAWRGNLADQLEPPSDARVVCFHGKPRPHEVGGWVSEHWNKEGVSLQAA